MIIMRWIEQVLTLMYQMYVPASMALIFLHFFQSTTKAGESLVLGLHEVAGGDGDTYTEVFKVFIL